MIEPLGDQDNGFAAFVHSLGYPIQENLTHNLQQGAQMKLVLVLVGFLTIILAWRDLSTVTPFRSGGRLAMGASHVFRYPPGRNVATDPSAYPSGHRGDDSHAHAYPSGHRGDDSHAHAYPSGHRGDDSHAHAYPSGHRGDDCHAHAYPSGHRGDDCHAHAVFDTHAYYDAGTNPEGYRGGYSGPDHHSRTDGDPGANGYRCPYCNSHTNSYSYASAANTYSHTATPGE